MERYNVEFGIYNSDGTATKIKCEYIVQIFFNVDDGYRAHIYKAEPFVPGEPMIPTLEHNIPGKETYLQAVSAVKRWVAHEAVNEIAMEEFVVVSPL